MYKKRLLPLCIALSVTGQLQAQEEQSQTDEIIITGVRSAELNAREVERSKNIFSSVISQDDAGKFADQNVAESLQRLPGITLQKTEGEGQYVTVRGLGPGFVNVSMNGNELASTSSDSRAFALDAVPSDLLSSIEVFKSLTPDMDLNSIGGSVNVKTLNAFDRKKDTLRVSGQASEQIYNGDTSPKVSIQGTNLFADQTIGLGYSLSYEKRGTDGYLNQHHAEQDLTYRQENHGGLTGPTGPRLLTPWQFEVREEQAERERIAASVDLGWRPNENSDYYLRYTRTSMEDMDIALREYYRFDTALTVEDEVPYIDTATGTFGVTDAELQHQFYIQKGEAITDAFDIGGENKFSDESWVLDYKYSHSVGEFSKPDGRRVQFRIQDLPMLGRAGEDYIAAQIISPAEMAALAETTTNNLVNTGGYFLMNDGQRKQNGMTYDNIFIEDSFRTETLDQIGVNLRRNFDDESFVNYIKTGFVIKDRERDRNKDRWSIVPGNYPNACGGDTECQDLRNSSLADFETYTPAHPDMQYDFITRSETERLLAATSRIAKYTDPNLTGQESTKEDYLLTEESQAIYLMAEFQTSENSTLITGVRYEKVDFASDGYLSIRNDRFTETDNAENSNLDIAIPLENTDTSYDDLFPSIHYRYDMAEDTLVRASIWTSFTRPSFDQARAFGEVVGRVVLCNPDTLVCDDNPPANGGVINSQRQITTASGTPFTMASDNTLDIGNPNLVAMTAVNFDTSISWYGDNGDNWQIAAFYKEIDDFIVNVRGASLTIDQLPLQLPLNQVTQFSIPNNLMIERVNFATNGDSAKVYGVELSYSKYFDSGLFVQTNMTLMDSDAEVGETLRVGSIQLPEQADTTINLSIGWENDSYSARLIGNYRSEILKRVGSCNAQAIAADASLGYAEYCRTWADIYQDVSKTLDFKATYAYNKALQFSFDVTNLTNSKDVYYFKGNESSGGKVMFATEDYGSTYLLGMSYKFM